MFDTMSTDGTAGVGWIGTKVRFKSIIQVITLVITCYNRLSKS